MTTILSFQDKKHRVQLVEVPVGFIVKFVIYDNRKIIDTFLDDENGARRRFYTYVGFIVLDPGIKFSN